MKLHLVSQEGNTYKFIADEACKSVLEYCHIELKGNDCDIQPIKVINSKKI